VRVSGIGKIVQWLKTLPRTLDKSNPHGILRGANWTAETQRGRAATKKGKSMS
jgi:hypothetical protein